jgi:hypothetical protein
MRKTLICLLLGAVAGLGQYTAEPVGAPPSDLSAEIIAELAPEGYKIAGADGTVWAEVWFRNGPVEGAPSGEMDVSWADVPHGTLIGAIRFPAKGEGRRGTQVQPGVYTLRFSFYPIDGAHQGVEPSRDFLIMSKAEEDTDPTATPSFADLMKMSTNVSGTSHPATMACWKAEGDWQEGLSQMEHDWVLGVKLGETELMVIVKGVNTHA